MWRSGRLAGSIHAEETDSGAAIVARIGVAGAAGVYAPVQEYGGVFTIRAHLATIREAWGKPLAGGARQVAVKSHLARYPKHSFMRSALAEMRGDIEDGIADAVTPGGNGERCMSLARETYHGAVFARLQVARPAPSGSAVFVTVSRRLEHWTDVPPLAARRLLVQRREKPRQDKGRPPVELAVDLYVYVTYATRRHGSASLLNSALDAIDAAFAPDPTEVDSLGGLALCDRPGRHRHRRGRGSATRPSPSYRFSIEVTGCRRDASCSTMSAPRLPPPQARASDSMTRARPADRIDKAIDGWVADNFANSLATTDSEIWNALMTIPNLKHLTPDPSVSHPLARLIPLENSP